MDASTPRLQKVVNHQGHSTTEQECSNPVTGHMPDIPVSSPGKKEIEEIEKD